MRPAVERFAKAIDALEAKDGKKSARGWWRDADYEYLCRALLGEVAVLLVAIGRNDPPPTMRSAAVEAGRWAMYVFDVARQKQSDARRLGGDADA